jgi:hypothetical protein
MKILIEFDSLTNDVRIVSKSIPTKKDIINECCQYCGISYLNLVGTPLLKEQEYVTCRWLITYFLTVICNTEQEEVARTLNYSDRSIISINLKEFKEKMSINDEIIARPYYNLCKILGVVPDNFK